MCLQGAHLLEDFIGVGGAKVEFCEAGAAAAAAAPSAGAGRGYAALEAVLAKLVVHLPLLRVGEHLQGAGAADIHTSSDGAGVADS